jgi:hypothetical protein
VHYTQRLRDAEGKACRKEENNIQELSELIHTYCPSGKVYCIVCCDTMQLLLFVYTCVGGLLMDLFAGTVKIAMAALLTGRRCIVADKDPKVLALGVNRAKLYYTYLKKNMLLPVLGTEQMLKTTLEQHAVQEWMRDLPVELQQKSSTAFWKVCVCVCL